MKKIILKYGLIGGGIVSLLMISSFLMLDVGSIDFQMGQILGYATMLLALSSIFFGIKAYRTSYNNGTISFGEAFKVGILITVVAALIYVITWMIYYSVGGGQEMMDAYFTENLNKLQESGMEQAKIDAQIKQANNMQEMYKNPAVRAGLTFLEIFPVGLIITLFSALILKKKAA